VSRNSKQELSRQANPVGNARRLTLWFETSAVLLLIAGSILSRVLCWVLWGSAYLQYDKRFFDLQTQTPTTYGIKLFESMIGNLGLIPIVLFIIWRSGDTWSRFGLVKPKWKNDILIGLGLFLIVTVVRDELVGSLFANDSFTFTWWNLFPAANPPVHTLLLIASACAIGLSEELTFRAYLIPRLEELMGAAWKGVLFSSVIFAMLHLYNGAPGVVASFLYGVIWGVGFCLTRRIWPVAIAHALNDLVCMSHINSLIGS
jgi:membrane protease YdiL (CAAX protease family)